MPQLYDSGKVCLSLLGTWHGGSRAEEWNENSTLLQVFVSIQALILIKYPVYNEPGVERQQGTPEGDRIQRTSQNGGYERLRVGTVQWAMVDQLQNPPKGFEVGGRGQSLHARGCRHLAHNSMRRRALCSAFTRTP